MTAFAQIAGTAREVPDSSSASLPASGKSHKSDFRSVLEEYHASRENASETNETQGATQQKQKTSDPATTHAGTQPMTPAPDVPRLILPFAPSITLRQEATSQDDASVEDGTSSLDDSATPDSTASAATNSTTSVIANPPAATAILRSTLDLRSLPWVRDTKTNRAADAAQPTTLAKSKDSGPSQTAVAPLANTVPADPLLPVLPVTAAITLEQGATVVKTSSTVSEAPYTVSTSTSDRAIAYQFRPSNERPTETIIGNRTSQADPSQAVALPMSVANPSEPQPPIHPLAVSNTPGQDSRVLDSGSAGPQDLSVSPGADPKITIPPALERADNPNDGALAFAARLSPTTELPQSASDSNRPTGSQTPSQLTIPVTTKQVATGADLPADTRSGDGGGQSNKEKASELFAKPETLLPQIHAAVPDQTAIPANNHASTSPLSAAARMDQVIDPPAAPSNTSHDITVRIPDSTDQGTAVRFVERAGEIHVSVRTGDVEVAQSLRGGLNDLVNHLEDGGIRTEVWQPGPGSNGASSQSDSHQPFADPDGSNGRQHSSGSNSEQDAKQQNKPRWVEELEGSIGNPDFKETK